MTIRWEKGHDYLGMRLDISKPGKIMVNMETYLDEIFHHLPSDMDGNTTTPAPEHQFKTCLDAGLLDKETMDFFHHMTAQLQSLCRRVQLDIQTAVSFLQSCEAARE